MDGILVVYKPAGMTSHDVVFSLRKKLGIRKIGHTGTLDPEVDGVLLVLVGKACKILQFLSDTDKTYRASLQLGYTTDTMDMHGNILERKEINSDFDLEEVLQSFIGNLHQLVPMTSAKKINGKKLIEYQRQHIDIGPVYQDVMIYDINLVDNDSMTFDVHCSSGTYVRSLCVSIAQKTGNLGCMKSLTRTKVGRFSIEQAQTIEEIQKSPRLYSISMLLEHLPSVNLEDPIDVYHGKRIHLDQEDPLVVIYDQGAPIAVYEKEQEDIYRSKRGLW